MELIDLWSGQEPFLARLKVSLLFLFGVIDAMFWSCARSFVSLFLIATQIFMAKSLSTSDNVSNQIVNIGLVYQVCT